MSKIILGLCGSVAAIKAVELFQSLQKLGNVKVILTSSAEKFISYAELVAAGATVFRDEDEHKSFRGRGDPVLHIELREWADCMVVAPLSANTLAKLANGLCDNLLTCVLRAWDLRRPVFVAPAMNTLMWTHPFTSRHLQVLTADLGFHVIQPISKTLMCGQTGVGALAAPADIALFVQSHLQRSQTLFVFQVQNHQQICPPFYKRALKISHCSWNQD
jgi:phosphopantothenoylcysteine decarboxylase